MDWTDRKRAQRRGDEDRARAFKRYVHPSTHANYRRYVAYVGEMEIYRSPSHRLTRERAIMHARSMGMDPSDIQIEVEMAA